MKTKFNSQYYIEYRFEKNGPLLFVKNNLNDLDVAMKERERILKLGAYEVLVKKNEFFRN